MLWKFPWNQPFFTDCFSPKVALKILWNFSKISWFFRKSVVLISLINKSIVCHPWTPWQDFFVGVNLAFQPSFPQINKWKWSFAFHQSASHVPTQEERDWAREEMKRRKEYEQNASEERKNFMQTMELKRKENAKPSDLEQVNYCINWKMKNIKGLKAELSSVKSYVDFFLTRIASIFICDLNWFLRKTLLCIFLRYFLLIFVQITYAKNALGPLVWNRNKRNQNQKVLCFAKSTKNILRLDSTDILFFHQHTVSNIQWNLDLTNLFIMKSLI